MRTTRRRNILIVAGLLGLAVIIGVVAARRHTARESLAADPANLPVEQLRNDATQGVAAPSSTTAQGAHATSDLDSPAPKHVVIAKVRPWVDIAGMPAYERASPAERMAIRDLYWRICVEDRIPLEQQAVMYAQFVQKWASHEAGTPESPVPTSSSEIPPELQAKAPSPVDTMTMRRWCQR